MNCADVSRALREPQLPLQAREHLQNCKSCQELVRALDSPVVVDAPAPQPCGISQKASPLTCAQCALSLRQATFSEQSWVSLFPSPLLASIAWGRMPSRL